MAGRRPARVKKTEVQRAIAAATSAGLDVSQIEIDPATGRIRMFISKPGAQDELDRELAAFEASHES